MGVFMSEYTEMPSSDPFSLIPLYKQLIGRLEMLKPPSIIDVHFNIPKGKTYGASPGTLALRALRALPKIRAMAADAELAVSVSTPWWKDDERRNRRLKKLRATWARKRRARR